MKTKCSTLLTL